MKNTNIPEWRRWWCFCHSIPRILFFLYLPTIGIILTTTDVVSSSSSWDVKLIIDRPAGEARGGEAFDIQPIVSAFDRKVLRKHVDMIGARIEAELYYSSYEEEGSSSLSSSLSSSSSSLSLEHYEQLHRFVSSSGKCTSVVEPNKKGRGIISSPLINGTATFQNLCIPTAGSNYTINYTLKDQYNIPLGHVIGSSDISVSVGEAYQLGVIRPPSGVTGGIVWDVMPIVAVQDRGYNTICSVNNGTVRIELLTNSHVSESLHYLDENENNNTLPSISWKNGTAEFHSLYIQKAGSNYQLKFSTDLKNLTGGNDTVSPPFAVFTGKPLELLVVEEPSSGGGDGQTTTTGGRAFIRQPSLKLVDAGGNILLDDSSSKVSASLYNNPNGDGSTPASLYPYERRMAPVIKGMVQFRHLSIDKAGVGYRIKYVLWRNYSSSYDEEQQLNETDIVVYGSFFHVDIGPAQRLQIIRSPSTMWAGNQPYLIQPKVALVDAGGNILTHDSNTSMQAFVVPSLSQRTDIIIDTTDDPVPVVVSVEYDESSSFIREDSSGVVSYSPGQCIDIIVIFSQEVFVSVGSRASNGTSQQQPVLVLPSLELNVVEGNGTNAMAWLLLNYTTWNIPSNRLIFQYVVENNSDHYPLDYVDEGSLRTNDYDILDGWNRNVSIQLPGISSNSTLAASKDIAIESYHASVTNITTDIASGEYGAGNNLVIYVHFSRQVAVMGTPRLSLNLKSSVVVIETRQLGTSLSKSYFYVRYKNERSPSIPWDAPSEFVQSIIEGMIEMSGSLCVSRSPSDSVGFRWAIRFDSVEDNIHAGLSIERADVTLDHESMDVAAFFLLTNTPLSNWTNSSGDESMCTSRYAVYEGGNGTKKLSFVYTTLPGDDTSRLELFSPQNEVAQLDTKNGEISNAINSGSNSSVNATLSLGNITFLEGKNISIDTSSPSVENITVQSTSFLNRTYGAGDELYFILTFNKPVLVNASIELSLNVGRSQNRAIMSGSGTNTLVLKYTVVEGQIASALDYNGPNALTITSGYIRQKANNPTTDAILVLPSPHLQFSSPVIVHANRPKIVSVSFGSGHAGRVFNEHDQISIVLFFSSSIIIYNGPPVLILNVGGEYREAMYVSGSGSDSLTFNYTVLVGDAFPSSVFTCAKVCISAGCLKEYSAENYIRQLSYNPSLDADLTFPPMEAIHTLGFPIDTLENAIIIDTSTAPQPKVMSVTTLHHNGVFGVGEEIRYFLTFTDAVFCDGNVPKLFLSTNSNATYEHGSGTNALVFRQLITNLDVTDELKWMLLPQSNTSVICGNISPYPCSIKNVNGVHADLDFVDEDGLQFISSLNANISIDLTTPRVLAVYSNTNTPQHCSVLPKDCYYTAGDQVDIYVKFDSPVQISGPSPMLKMAVLFDEEKIGDVPDVYAFFNSNLSNESDIAFRFNINVGHSTNGTNLTYGCLPQDCSISLGTEGQQSTIRRKSTYPSINANLTLPYPSSLGVLNNEQNPIVVHTELVPNVLELYSQSTNGTYSPGDVINITIRFDDFVNVIGVPELHLNVGGGDIGIAKYASGSETKELFFEYFVQPQHNTERLDYIDVHSLCTRDDEIDGITAYIRRSSKNPTLPVNLQLPLPGTKGSLSETSDIAVDCRVPSVLAIWSSSEKGRFVTGDILYISVQFTRPVIVTGLPSLKLETGKIDREAIYNYQPNNVTLEFQYKVQLGDSTDDLDYWTDEGLVRSSMSSFQLNDGSIMLLASRPIVKADTHLNPALGFLSGTTTIQLGEGEAEFLDLKIGKRGNDYKIRFTINNKLEATSTSIIGHSCEYQLIGDESGRESGDKFGASVTLQGSLLAVGTPHKQRSSPEIQVLQVQSGSATVQSEVQLITTQLNKIDGTEQIQKFTTASAPNETITGTFTVSYLDRNYTHGAPITIPASVGAYQLQTIIKKVLPDLGEVVVSRVKNYDCSCSNGWSWIVTFRDASSGIVLLKTDGTGLIGNGSQISPSELVKTTNMIGGNFSLFNPQNGEKTRHISFNASENEIKQILEEDLLVHVKSVLMSNTDVRDRPELGRRWRITFSHHVTQYGNDINVPNLQVYDSNLTGSSAIVWTHVGFEGKGPLSGSFALSFRQSYLSEFIPANAHSNQVEDALESLASINDVSVSSRKELNSISSKHSGSVWTITFHSINRETEYGWILDIGGKSSFGNLPPIEVSSQLIGWNAKYVIGHEFGAGPMDTQAQWMAKNMGDDGAFSGQVTVYHQSSNQWYIESFLTASDGNSHDNFGHSISLDNSYIAVGAPSKEVDGLSEEQTITCVGPATEGTFRVQFRGSKSDKIPHNATLEEIRMAIVGTYGNTSNIHSLPEILVDKNGDWVEDDTGFCDSHSNIVIITLLTPDGGGLSTVSLASGDVESFTIDGSELIGASISVAETRKGTKSLSGGYNAQRTGKQSGSVYIYQRHRLCDFCPFLWTQKNKITPLDGRDYLSNSAKFGWSVALGPASDGASELLLIGSPGFNNESGKVYIFRGNATDWNYDSTLTSKIWEKTSSGDLFGHSVHINGETVLVCAPGNRLSKGAVYIFRRDVRTIGFLSSQAIYGPRNLEAGDRFGHSASLSNNRAVICAPHHDELLHGKIGACYVYSRGSAAKKFEYVQQLIPSNLKERDRFGWSLAISGDTILIGQLQDYTGDLISSAPVQVVTTYCAAEVCIEPLGSTFSLSLRDMIIEDLPASITAIRMKNAIENNFQTGSVSVSRTHEADNNGGYSWSITFNALGSDNMNAQIIPAIICDTRKMVGSQPACSVVASHTPLQNIRGKAHIFTFEDGAWTEQSFLSPEHPQLQDLFGSSVALDHDQALVGAPNRQLGNVNSGAAIVFDISFVGLRFPTSHNHVIEGNSLTLQVHRKISQKSQIVSFRSMDKNADLEMQDTVNYMYNFRNSELAPLEKTNMDLMTGNTAFGRDQYYGSAENRSLWIRGMFDYRGINDYKLVQESQVISEGEDSVTLQIKTTNDSIFEAPNENLTVHIDMPGMLASPLGGLRTDITIDDDGDGVEGNETIWQKLFANPIEMGDSFGSAIDVHHGAGIMVVGSEQHKKSGAAFVFKRVIGRWVQVAQLLPSLSNGNDNALFGQSVSVDKPYGRDDTTVLVGAPGQALTYVFVYNMNNETWEEQAILKANDQNLVSGEYQYGRSGAIALNGDVAFVGAPMLEAVYVYRRHFLAGHANITWSLWSILRSSDYDYDLYDRGNSVRHIHQQSFGITLDVSGRLLLVGAPYADYGNRGNASTRETYNTDGVHNIGIGKGKVFAFHSYPITQKVNFHCDATPKEGNFRLELHNTSGIMNSSFDIHLSADAEDVRRLLESAMGVGELHVNKSTIIAQGPNESYTIIWSITFLSIFSDSISLLTPTWYGNGCSDCVPITSTNSSYLNPNISVIEGFSMDNSFTQEYEMQGRDVTGGDRFGYSIALDGNQAIIGAMYSSAKTRTTWNFETGSLIGWTATGHAFDFQPTYGDNSRRRTVYEGFGLPRSRTTGGPQSSLMRGRYYIGTYEKRPRVEDSEGTVQGDEPLGTLKSDPFIIRGDVISFLIGGGCNHLTVYVELLVDGFATMRTTGKCDERMDRVYWQVAVHMDRSAQIRLVDNDKDKWGHINVDDIQFSWDLHGSCRSHNVGECTNGGGTISEQSDTVRQHYTGPEESAMSGAAYIFSRQCNDTACIWLEEQRLVPSDKRSGNLFGSSVAISDREGVAFVGSPYAPLYGFYKETPSIYPHHKRGILKFPIDQSLENLMKSGTTYSPLSGNLRLLDHLMQDVVEVEGLLPENINERAGATYIFLRVPAEVDSSGGLVKSSYWQPTEDAKIVPPNSFANDMFGYSVAISGVTAVSTAIGDDSYAGKEGGAAFVFDIKSQRVRFVKVVYIILEGANNNEIIIEIERSDLYMNFTTTVGYSTSDISAVGVDHWKFNSCLDIALEERGGCGDYEQTSGKVIFEKGAKSANFIVRIMDDLCWERHMKYLQLNLHILGGGVIQGEGYRAQLRIDDDDWAGQTCITGIE